MLVCSLNYNKSGTLLKNKFNINFLILCLVILRKIIKSGYIIIAILSRFKNREINIKLFLNTIILLLNSRAIVLFS